MLSFSSLLYLERNLTSRTSLHTVVDGLHGFMATMRMANSSRFFFPFVVAIWRTQYCTYQQYNTKNSHNNLMRNRSGFLCIWLAVWSRLPESLVEWSADCTGEGVEKTGEDCTRSLSLTLSHFAEQSPRSHPCLCCSMLKASLSIAQSLIERGKKAQ